MLDRSQTEITPHTEDELKDNEKSGKSNINNRKIVAVWQYYQVLLCNAS